jgi:DNA-binding PadR family transcriptional regulator
MRDTRPLTTTSFAILGLLALRPWRTYDLAKQARRSLSHFWPRAESNLYAEAKRLVAGGYAAAQFEQCGGRRRTVYTITPRGHKALRLWISEPGGAVLSESEPLLKVFYADQGSKADLLETIRAIGKASEQEKAHLQIMAQEYRAGQGPFPERLAINLLAVGLVWDRLEATIAWAARAAAEVESWNSLEPRKLTPSMANMFSRLTEPSITHAETGTAKFHSALPVAKKVAKAAKKPIKENVRKGEAHKSVRARR